MPRNLELLKKIRKGNVGKTQRSRGKWCGEWGLSQAGSWRPLCGTLCYLICSLLISSFYRLDTSHMFKVPSLGKGKGYSNLLLPNSKVMSFLWSCLLSQFPLPSKVRCFTRYRNYKSSHGFYIVSLHRISPHRVAILVYKQEGTKVIN
jgi:hypothetical protein